MMFFKKQKQKITHNIARLERERRCKKPIPLNCHKNNHQFCRRKFLQFLIAGTPTQGLIPSQLCERSEWSFPREGHLFLSRSWKNAGDSVLLLWRRKSLLLWKMPKHWTWFISLGSTSCAVADSACLFHCTTDWVRIPQNGVFQLSHRRHKML